MTVAELLNDPSKWTQRAYARNEDGQGVPSKSQDAVCWCLIGALNRCYSRDHDSAYDESKPSYMDVYAKVCQALLTRPEVVEQMQQQHDSMPNPGKWNDAPGRTFAEVRALVEQAGV